MVTLSPVPIAFSIVLGLGSLALSGCSGGRSSPNDPPEPPPGRYRIIQIGGREPGTHEALQIDTATGSTWRLVKATPPGSYDDIGWHPIADLTIESRQPYYRSRPDLIRQLPNR